MSRQADDEWPADDFGFVWGCVWDCVWGDDSSREVQYLDLSQVAAGVIRRDDRFGYLRLRSEARLRGSRPAPAGAATAWRSIAAPPR